MPDNDSKVNIAAGGVPIEAESTDQHAMCVCCKLPITDNSSPQFCTYCREGTTRPASEIPVGTPKIVDHHWTGCKLISRKYRRALWKQVRKEDRHAKSKKHNESDANS